MQAILLFLSALLVAAGPITYIVSIVKGKTRPHRMTRFILAFVLTLNFVSIVSAKGNLGAEVFSGITCLQALVIFGMSLWRGMGGTSVVDFVCLVIAAMGILGWKLTGDPIIGVWFSVIADFAAYVPAFIKTYKHPHTESAWYYILSGFAAFFSLIAYKIEPSSIFQIYILSCVIVMVVLIYRKDIQKKLKTI